MSNLASLISTKIGRYTILERLGAGGMATVFKAEDANLKRTVAIKILHEHLTFESNLRERFEQEAHIIASFNHPNIVQVFDFDVLERNGSQLYYMVMPLITGQSLSEWIEDYRKKDLLPPLDQVKQIMLDLTSALTYAHKNGMIHRDVKPANVLFNQDQRAILTDFGIARLVKSSGMTQEGSIVGTPAYMAPEQALGGDIDHRSDLYALGVILFELLTGRVPFDGDSTASVIIKHIQDIPPSVTEFIGEENHHFEQMVARALSKHPADRYQSAEAFSNAIQQIYESSPENRARPNFMHDYSQPPTIVLSASTPKQRTTTIMQAIETVVIKPARQNPLAFVALFIAMATLLLVARVLQDPPSNNVVVITQMSPTSIPSILSMTGETVQSMTGETVQSMTGDTVESMTGDGVQSMTGDDFFFMSSFEEDDATRPFWQVSNEGLVLRSFSPEGGEYIISNMESGTATSTLFSPNSSYGNVTISIEATLDPSSTRNSGYGIVFRYQDPDNYNVFAVDGQGRFSVWVRENSVWRELRGESENWTINDAVRPIGESNMITIRIYYGMLQGIINGEKVIEVDDMTFRDGAIGIYLATPSQGTATVRVNTYIAEQSGAIIPSMTVGS